MLKSCPAHFMLSYDAVCGVWVAGWMCVGLLNVMKSVVFRSTGTIAWTFGGMKQWRAPKERVNQNGWMLKILCSCFTQGNNICSVYSLNQSNNNNSLKQRNNNKQKIQPVLLHMMWCVVTRLFWFSGSTGKPKGVLHTTGGYMLYTATTFK